MQPFYLAYCANHWSGFVLVVATEDFMLYTCPQLVESLL